MNKVSLGGQLILERKEEKEVSQTSLCVVCPGCCLWQGLKGRQENAGGAFLQGSKKSMSGTSQGQQD